MHLLPGQPSHLCVDWSTLDTRTLGHAACDCRPPPEAACATSAPDSDRHLTRWGPGLAAIATAADLTPSQLDSGADDAETVEVRFCPAEPALLDQIWGAMSECASLHPDPEEEDEEGGGFIGDGDEFVGPADTAVAFGDHKACVPYVAASWMRVRCEIRPSPRASNRRRSVSHRTVRGI